MCLSNLCEIIATWQIACLSQQWSAWLALTSHVNVWTIWANVQGIIWSWSDINHMVVHPIQPTLDIEAPGDHMISLWFSLDCNQLVRSIGLGGLPISEICQSGWATSQLGLSFSQIITKKWLPLTLFPQSHYVPSQIFAFPDLQY